MNFNDKEATGTCLITHNAALFLSYRRKEAKRDKPDIMKIEVHPSNQGILWKCTGAFCKQLKLDLKCIQKGVLPNLKVKAGKI